MATVKMIKGNKYADIFDSPETIEQAEKEGYVLAEDNSVKKTEVSTNSVTEADEAGTEEKYVTDKDLQELTVAQLKELGKSYGIKVYNLNNKTDLIKALSAVKVTVESFESLKA